MIRRSSSALCGCVVLLSLSCTEPAVQLDSGVACDAEDGTLHGVVWSSPMEDLPEGGAAVFLWLPQEEWPVEARADAEGRYEVVLPAGVLSVEASNAQGTCFTAAPTEVEVQSCGRQRHDLHMARWLD